MVRVLLLSMLVAGCTGGMMYVEEEDPATLGPVSECYGFPESLEPEAATYTFMSCQTHPSGYWKCETVVLATQERGLEHE